MMWNYVFRLLVIGFACAAVACGSDEGASGSGASGSESVDSNNFAGDYAFKGVSCEFDEDEVLFALERFSIEQTGEALVLTVKDPGETAFETGEAFSGALELAEADELAEEILATGIEEVPFADFSDSLSCIGFFIIEELLTVANESEGLEDAAGFPALGVGDLFVDCIDAAGDSECVLLYSTE